MSSLLVVDETDQIVYITDGTMTRAVGNLSTTPKPADDPIAYNPIEALADGTSVYLIMADTTGTTSALYQYDGTTIRQVTTASDYVSSAYDSNQAGAESMVSFNGSIIFAMESANAANGDGGGGATLAKVDSATGAVSAISVPNGGTDPTGFTQLGGKLYFIGQDTTTNQGSLYVYDGTTVSEIVTGQSVTGAIAAFNGKIYFGSTSSSVYQYNPADGTTTNVTTLDSNNPSLSTNNFIVFNNKLFVSSPTVGVYSISMNNTVSLFVDSIGAQSFNPVVYNNKLYYVSYHLPTNGNFLVPALYVSTDGVNSTLIRDNTSAQGLTVANGVLNFSDGTTGQTITYNGTSFSTIAYPGATGSLTPLTAVSFDVPPAPWSLVVATTTFPEDRTALAFTANGETVYTIGTNGGTLQIVDAGNGNAVLDQQTVTGDFTKGLFTLAADGTGGTTINFNADASLSFAQGHVVLANIVGQSASAYQDADAAGEFIGTGSATTTIGGSLVLGGGVATSNANTVVQTGIVQIGDANAAAASLTNTMGGDYRLSGDVGLAAGTGSATSTFANAGGILEKTAGTGISTIAVNVSAAGNAQGQIKVASGTLAFAGATNTFTNQLISGAGIFALTAGSADTIGAGTSISTGGWTVAGAGTNVTFGTNISYGGAFTAQDASSLLLGAYSLTLSGAATLGSTSSQAPTMLSGAGKIVASGTDTIANLSIGGSLLLRSTGSVTQTGTVLLGDGTGAAQITNAPGATWSLAGDVGIAATPVTATGAVPIFNNGGATLAKTSGTGISAVAANLANLAGTASAITVSSGTLRFLGASNSFQADAISGAGTFAIAAGLNTITGGTTITAAAWTITGTGSRVTLGQNLTYAQTFSITGSNTIDLGSFALTLSGPAAFASISGAPGAVEGGPRPQIPFSPGVPTILGTGKVVTSGATTVAGLTIGGNVLFRNTGTVTQTGDITLGNATGTPQITNAPGATWLMAGDVNITAPGPTAPTFNNGGSTLRKSAGSGTSTIGANIANLANTTSSIVVGTGTLRFTGATNLFVADAITGAGTVAFDGGSANTVGTGTTISTAGWTIAGTGTSVTLATALIYAGTFSATGGVTLTPAGSTLTLSGSATFGPAGGPAVPTITGTGTVLTSGTTTIAGLSVTGTTLLRNTGAVTQTGTVTLGNGTAVARVTNAPGGHWTLQGDVSILQGGSAGGTASIFNNGGSFFQKASGAGTSQIGVTFTNLAASAATIEVDAGTLQFTGLANSFVADAVTGAGTFALAGGSTSTISTGSTIASGGWTVGGDATAVTLAQSLSFGGSFGLSDKSTLALGSNSLTLSGAAAFSSGANGGPTVTGTGKIVTSGADTISGLTIGGKTLFRANGTVVQSGAITLGDSSNGAAQITDAGTWQITADVGIAAGSTAAVMNIGGGTLTKSGGTGLSLIAPAVTNLNPNASGTIEAASGTLELGGTLSGALQLKVDAGATLILDKAASAGTAASFAGSGGTLQLSNAPGYAGTVANFGGGDTIDLRSISFTNPGTSLSYSGNGGPGTLTVSDGTHIAKLSMVGNYSQGSFGLASDSHGGTAVSYLLPT